MKVTTRVLRALLRPWTWAKLVASATALITNAVQLSEVANEYGEPMPGLEAQWHVRAALVAFEATQLRLHVEAKGET